MSIAVQTSETHHASPQALRDARHALSSQKSLRIRDAAHSSAYPKPSCSPPASANT